MRTYVSFERMRQVRGFPQPRVTWYKDGEPLAPVDGKRAIASTETGSCTLTIIDAADGDAGRYACEAINDRGRVCTLTVVEVTANRRVVEAERRLQRLVYARFNLPLMITTNEETEGTRPRMDDTVYE